YNKSKRNVRELALLCHIASSVARWHQRMGASLQRSEACMTFVRPARRVVFAVASMGALFVAAACGGGGGSAPEGGGTSPAAAEFTKQGDTEWWTGKDLSGNNKTLVDQFNAQHPNGKVILHELPNQADQQRQQMIQNTQIKNQKMGILEMDVVWTAN